MSVRTYNPSVRVGNWNEDLCLEEVGKSANVAMALDYYTLRSIIGATEGLSGEERQGRTDGAEKDKLPQDYPQKCQSVLLKLQFRIYERKYSLFFTG